MDLWIQQSRNDFIEREGGVLVDCDLCPFKRNSLISVGLKV